MALRKNRHNYSAARRQRREMSLPEGLLWRELRRSPHGINFRRQHPVGPYVIDFYCAQAKTGFEIDGFAHDMGNRPERDEQRTAWLESQGLTIVRIPARDVLNDPLRVAETIVALCRKSGN
ncbi:MAG: endonuclease domain-containing protein [Novosphingobium sp.]